MSTEFHVYSNTGAGDPIDYASAVATTATLAYTTSALSFPGTWSFGVRAFDTVSGLEEQNLDCALTIVLDASGNDITNRPGPPLGLRAFALAGGSVRAEWFYPPTSGPRTPTGFHVYSGVGPLSYSTPTATVLFSQGIANSYVTNMSGFTDRTTYTIGVRAFNATAEEMNTNTAAVMAIATGPAPVDGLVGVATVHRADLSLSPLSVVRCCFDCARLRLSARIRTRTTRTARSFQRTTDHRPRTRRTADNGQLTTDQTND